MSLATKRVVPNAGRALNLSSLPLRAALAQILCLILFTQTIAPPALASAARVSANSPRGAEPSRPLPTSRDVHAAPSGNATAATVQQPAVVPAPQNFGVVLTPLTTPFGGHAGIDYHQPTRTVVTSANSPTGQPNNFELIDGAGAHRAYSNVSGLPGSLKMAVARDDGQGVSVGGFKPGELFTGTGAAGVVARVAADGASVQNPWVTLPNEAGLPAGLFLDRTGVFGGDLVVVTTTGRVWRINSARAATKVADLGTPLEGVTTLPNDADKYGPWAGKILVGAKEQGALYSIDALGGAVQYPLGLNPEELRVIPAHENFFGVDPADGKVWGTPADAFAGVIGDVLVAQESPGVLARIHWNGSEFEIGQLAQTASWRQITFAPAGIGEIVGVRQIYDNIAVVRHAPYLASGRVEGALWQLLGENVALDGTDAITSDLLVPGTPTVSNSGGHTTFGGTLAGPNGAQPTGYTVTLSGNASLRYLITRTDPMTPAAVPDPPAPQGSRDVSLTQAGQSAGDFTTLRNLTLSGRAGAVAVPPGTYGTLSASSHTAFVLGVENSTTPALYNLRGLALAGGSELRLAGPVVLTVSGNVTLTGSTVGAANDPRRLLLKVSAGDVSLGGSSVMYAVVRAPQGGVSVAGSSRLRGTVTCDHLSVSGNGVLQVTENDVPQPPLNRPPSVDAGPDQTVTLPTDTVALNGLANDDGLPQGSTLAVLWSKVSGPGTVAFADPRRAATTASFSLPGTYVLHLKASDGQLSAGDDIVVKVNRANHAPVVDAGSDLSITLPASASLSGTVSDDGLPQGSVVSTTWSKASGPGSVTFADPSAPATTATFSDAGTYVLQLSASDGQLSAHDEINVTVIRENHAPVVSAGAAQTISLPNPAQLAGTASDDGQPAVATLALSWSMVSGPGAVNFGDPHSATTSASFSASGAYVLRLTADDTQLTGSSDVTITVNPANQPPSVNAGPDQTIILPGAASLNATASDDGYPAGGALALMWSAVSGPGTVTFADPHAAITTAAFSAAGTYVLRLTASDSQLSSSSDVIVTAVAANRPPTVSAGGDQTITLPNSATLAGSVSDDGQPAGAALVSTWSVVSGPGAVAFADANSPATTAAFSVPGVYVLRLAATDSQLSASSDTTVTVLPSGARAAIKGGRGTDFWLMFERSPNGRLSLSFVGDVSTTGRITIPGLRYAADFTVTPGQITTVNLPSEAMEAEFEKIERKGVHVVAADPVSVFGLNASTFANDGFLTLPTDALGTDYLALGYSDSLSQFGIVAVADNTTVTITPAATAFTFRNDHAPYTVTLNQGQTYQVGNPGYPGGGINGSVIKSDKPVAVFAGSSLTDLPYGYPHANHLVEQMFPVEDWGRDFVTMPLATRRNGDTFCILASVDSTHVSVNGASVATLNRGQVYEHIIDGPSHITADQPVLVAQYANSHAYDDPVTGDPTMILVPSTDHFADAYTFATINQDWDYGTPATINYVNVVAPAAAVGSVTLDGSAIPASSFVSIGDGGFAGAQVAVSRGAHKLAGPAPFGATVYGFAPFDAYGYPAGVSFATAQSGLKIALAPTLATVMAGDEDCTVATVTAGVGQPFAGLPVTFSVLGVNNGVGSALTDATGRAHLCYSGAHSGADLLIFTAGDVRATASRARKSAVPNQPPTVNAGADQTITLADGVPNTIVLTGSVTDDGLPDDHPVTYAWSQVSGPAAAHLNSPDRTFTAVDFTTEGTYVLRLTASDGLASGSDDVTVTVLRNNSPQVTASPSQLTVAVGQVAHLVGTATDDGKPVGSTLTTLWYLAGGPGNAAFSSTNALETNVSFNYPGTYYVRLQASDSQLTGYAQVIVTVTAANTAPTVSAGPAQTVDLPPGTAQLNGSVTDDGQPSGASIAAQWTAVSGPGAVVFANANQAVTSATFSAVGTYVLRLTASDTQLSSSADVTITVRQGNQPPTVSAGPAQTIPQNVSAQLSGAAHDDGLPSGGNLTTAWSVVSGPGAVTFADASASVTGATFSAPGTYVLRLTASDSQLTATSDVTITVTQAQAPPAVKIETPADSAEVTAPASVVGTVGSSVSAWRLEYGLNTADGAAGQTWTTFASGTGAVVSGALGTLDPTLMLNGLYTVRLVAADAYGQTATDSISVIVDKNLKVGNFTLAFTDLAVPLPGLSIDVVRAYDSRDKRAGDFGVGWTLALRNVRVEKTRTLGRDWYETKSNTFIPNYCLEAARPHVVTVTFPDNKTYKFQAVTTPRCQAAGPVSSATISFEPMPGTHGALAIEGASDALVAGSVPGPVDLIGYDNQDFFNAATYRLTVEDGTQYVVDQQGGVRSVSDPNGNTLTVDASGIHHSNGQSVAFTRDPQGRITQITDLSGNSLYYTYDQNGDLASFKDREGNVTTYGYDAAHYLLSINDPRGLQPIRNEYDASGRLLGHTDAFGKTIAYTHDLASRRETVTDRLGNQTVYEYDADGNVLYSKDAEGGEKRFTYDEFDDLLTETDALGRTTTYTYDARGNRTSVKDALGHTTGYTYDANAHVLTATDALNRTTTNAYDSGGNLLSTKDPLGNETKYTYNAYTGLRQTMTDARGNVTTYEYDSAGNTTKETDAAGHETRYINGAPGQHTSQIQTRTLADGTTETLTTNFEYDHDGRLTKTTYPDGTTTKVEYNAIGQQGATVDQAGRRTEYAYDEMGRLTKTTHPDGKTEQTTYDAEGRRLTTTDRAGHVTTFTYDKVGRLVTTKYADNKTTSTAYDAAGQVLTTTDALGHATTYTYDDAGRRATVKGALDHVTAFEYDAAGNQTKVTDAKGHATQYEYDADGRRTKTVYADGTFEAAGYDELGRSVSKTDQAGKTTHFDYDKLGRLVKVTDALNQVTQYGYDELGRQVSQTDADNHTTRFEYDGLGRRSRRVLPLGQSESYAYNADGTLRARTDFNGKTTTYAYDSLRRLLSKTPDASLSQPAISFTYNAAGQRETMTDAAGTTTYAYDARYRLTSKATPAGTLNYTYDDAGNLKTVRSSNLNGASVDYSYDLLNRLSQVTDNRQPAGQQQTTYAYDNVGNLQGYAYPNAVTSTYTYNSLNRLTNLSIGSSSAALAGYAYTLGAAGNRLSVTEQNGRTVTYTYDDLYRLTNETIASDPSSGNGAIGYTYDAVGNRLSRTSTQPSVVAQTSTYDANDRLTSDTYDPNGNTTVSQGSHYAYDFENHLLTANDGGVTCLYDGDGNRVAKTVGGVTTKYLVDTNGPTGYAQVVDELQGGSVIRSYTYGSERISQRQLLGGNWATSYYGYDGHGSVRLLTDAQGAVTDTYTYDAFGNLIGGTGATPNEYLYAGERVDAGTGFYYLRARYLNPASGRFFSMDSFEGSSTDPGSLHKYLYAAANAVNRIDPSGHFSVAEVDFTISISETLAANTALILGTTETAVTTEVGASTLATLVGESIIVSNETASAAAFITAVGVGITVANWNDSDRVVYRVLRPDENPSVGLVAKAPYANKSPEEHVSEGSDPNFKSQWISTTTQIDIAEKWASRTGNRIVEINLSLVPTVTIDLSTEAGRDAHLVSKRAKAFARASSELLIERYVPPPAVRPIS